MKIELRRISFNARLSRETNAFAADLYIDGKCVGTAENDGGGGETIVRIVPKELMQQAVEYAQSLPPYTYPATEHSPAQTFPMDLELLIDTQLEQYLREKHETAQYKRWCRKRLLFRLKGDQAGCWRELAGAYTPELVARVRAKHGEQLGEILNECFLPTRLPH